MADVVWQGSSSTAAGTAANWVGGSLPGSGDVVVFNSTADANCVWDASAIATVQGLRIESNFDAILQFNAAGSLNLTSAGLEIQAAGKISAAAAFTFAFSGALPFTGNIESYVKIDSSNDSNLDTGNIAYTGMFDSTATRGLFTFTFAIPAGVDVIMDDGVYPNLTLTNASGTVFFAMIYGVPFNNYGIVDVLNFNVNAFVEIRKSSTTYYPVANDYLKRFVFNGTLTISSNYLYTYRSSVTYVPQSTAVFRFPADGETNYGDGANFYAQHYDVVIAPGDVAGEKCILDSGHILSCNSIRVLEGGVFVGPPEEPGSEIRSIKRPVIDGTWNFSQVADGIYSSHDAKPFFGVVQGGTGLQTITKSRLLIGNDMNALSTDANLNFEGNCLAVDQGIKIFEGSDHPISGASGYGVLWVNSGTNPNTLVFTDENGGDTTLGSGGGITALTGDVTASGSGSVAATIAAGAVEHAMLDSDCVDGDNIADDSINSEHYVDGSIDTAHIADDQVTYAKIQNVSATDRILGRDSAGAGIIEEITPANLRTMINVADGATAYSNAQAALASVQTAVFSATLGTSVSGFTSGSYTIAPIDNVIVDDNGAGSGSFDSGNHCWTVPVDGFYLVEFSASIRYISGSHLALSAVYVDSGSGYSARVFGTTVVGQSGAVTNGTAIISASASNKIALYVYHNGGSGKNLIGDSVSSYKTHLGIRLVHI